MKKRWRIVEDGEFDYFKNIDDAISKLPIEKPFNPWDVLNGIQLQNECECDREPIKLDPNDDLENFQPTR
jgi:hypothetical protein